MYSKEGTVNQKPLDTTASKDFEKSISYQFEKKTFVVETIFPKESKETFGSVLLRLIKTDISIA